MKYIPFYFERINENDKVIISNLLRDFLILRNDEFELFINKKIEKNSLLYKKLSDANFIYEESDLYKYSKTYLKTKESLLYSTFLHIFVLTLNCNLRCLYCQAEPKLYENTNTNMTKEIASDTIDFCLKSPTQNIQIEFQGGEPLLNFETLKYIVDEFKKRNSTKKISFSVVTNTQAMTEEICNYLIDNHVSLCFSFDGNKLIHDKNRPTKSGKSNYESVKTWLDYCYKRNVKVGLLPTITKYTIENYKSFYESLLQNDVRRFSIRELAPMGRCVKNWELIGYTADEFFEFYKKILNLILQTNKQEKNKIIESYTLMYLKLIYTKESNYFTDFRSPCGAGIGQLAYNWNGNIYTCDEGRMIANNNDETFKLGTVNNTYKECLSSENLSNVLCASCVEAHPICKNCVFNPICGICPVYNYSQTKTLHGLSLKNDRCVIFKKIASYIIENVEENTEMGKMFREWLSNDVIS